MDEGMKFATAVVIAAVVAIWTISVVPLFLLLWWVAWYPDMMKDIRSWRETRHFRHEIEDWEYVESSY